MKSKIHSDLNSPSHENLYILDFIQLQRVNATPPPLLLHFKKMNHNSHNNLALNSQHCACFMYIMCPHINLKQASLLSRVVCCEPGKGANSEGVDVGAGLSVGGARPLVLEVVVFVRATHNRPGQLMRIGGILV